MQVYGEEVEAEFLRRVASGETMTAVCMAEDMPSKETILAWRFGMNGHTKRDGFDERYMLARQIQADSWSDELIKMADEATVEDWQVVRLKLNTRQWIMGRLHPVRWGEGNQVDAGTIEHTIRVVLDDTKPKIIDADVSSKSEAPPLLDGEVGQGGTSNPMLPDQDAVQEAGSP